MEYLLPVALINLFLRDFYVVYSKLLLAVVSDALKAWRYFFRNLETYLQPVSGFRKSQTLHVAFVVWRVPELHETAVKVKVFYKHTLLVKVGDAHRTLYLCHA